MTGSAKDSKCSKYACTDAWFSDLMVGQKSLESLRKHKLWSPTPRVSELIGLGGVQECAFLTNPQVFTIVETIL